MRVFLKKRGLSLGLFLGAAVLLLATTSVAFGHRLQADDPAPVAEPLQRQTRSDAVLATAMVHVEALGVKTSQGTALTPPAATAAPVPNLDVRRDASLPAPVVPVEVGAELGLLSGESLRRTPGDAGEAQVQDASTSQVPLASPALLAAAALTGAGVLAWAWTSFKAAGKKLLVGPAIALYARITRAEVFDNDVRERLFESIRAEPGIAATDLARKVGVSWGTTIYHLEVLERNRMVTSLREGRHRRYFENGAGLQAPKEVVALLQNPVTANVAALVRSTPGATQKELAGATGMSPQALHWHLARLVGAGVVRKEREGRVVRHFSAN